MAVRQVSPRTSNPPAAEPRPRAKKGTWYSRHSRTAAQALVALQALVVLLAVAISAPATEGVNHPSPRSERFPHVAAADLGHLHCDAAVEAGCATLTPAQQAESSGGRFWLVTVLLYALYTVIFFVCVYIIRHYFFTLNRLFRTPRQPYIDIDTADWPPVTVLIPAHNEELVIEENLAALIDSDYPRDRLTIVPINDRSADETARRIQAFAAEYPDVVKPYHRKDGKPGKAAALQDAMARVETDIALVFDADYVPGRGLVKQLVAPFFDAEVGAVMGRVVPHNTETNLLTRLLDLERAGGYQVDQQARMNLKLVPQYGGTVGGVRKSALMSVGGWREDALAEDTDATYRLLLAGWKTVYQNRSECYEQVPDTWEPRLNQIRRWAKGHNQAAARYARRLLTSRRNNALEKLDGLLLLGVYAMSPLLLIGWMLGIVLWYLGEAKPGLIVILLVTSYCTLGNFATFFEVAAAAHLDGSRERIRLVPFISVGFLVNLFAVSRATLGQVLPRRKSEELLWHKTERNHNHNGVYNNNNNNHAQRKG